MRIPRSSKLRLILAMGLMALPAALALAPAGPAQAQASAGICDRSEQAQREILSHIPGVDDCAKVSDSHLSGITMMTIANSREPFAQRAGDFDGLANLDWLVMLYADSPRTLPDGLFDGLTNLDNLKLIFFAGPDTLPDGIFDELENLTILHLRIDEDLDSLPGDVFNALTKLKRLSVKFEAGPTELPEGVFDELTNLEWLIVRNKTPADLPEGAFDELAKLEKLEWTYGLTSLPGGAFDALTNLEELDLSRNYLTSLPGGVFDALTNLEELDLSRNYLTSLPDGVFDALTNLEELDLSRNAISSMPDELFDDLPESTDLTVDRQNRKSPPDYPTRGRPVINGVAQVGQTLTVSTSGMSDQNGMTEATFEYRWYTHPNRRELQGTSGYDEGDTYTVGPDDAGKRILVKVKYTDDAGNRESIKSARTAPVSPPPVEVIPPTSPQFLESSYLSPDRDEVEVVWSSPIYNGGSPITRYRIEWIEADGSWDAAAFAQGGVSEPLMDFGWQFEIVDLQPCMSYRIRVIASNIAGDGKASAETMPEAPYPLESTMPNLDEAVVNYAALTLTYDEVLNQNLMPPASAFNVTVEGTRRTVDTVAVEGQSVILTLAYVVTSADVVTVGYTNPAGTADGCIVGAAAGLAPSFSNWPATNNTGATDRPHGLRAAADSDVVTLTWRAPDADTDPSDYRILRHRPEAGETEPVVYVSSTGNTATSFTDTAVEPETLYVYRVQASDLNAQWGEMSEPVSIRVPRSNSPATGAPVITGMAQVGQTLTMYIHDIADADGMENTRFRIKWLADGMVIQGVYDHVLLLVAADEGKRIEVRVSFTDDAGNEENLTSTATDAVAARPNTPATGLPTISGMAQVDETMKADITGIADADGLTNAVFAHQWLADDADIQGATNSTYTLADSDEGRAIKVRVSFTDDAGNEESLTSAPTAAVAAPPPPPDNVRAVTQESGAVELTWEAPQDGTVTGYRIERSRADENRGGQQRSDGRPRDNHTLVEDTGSADTGYTDKSAEKGVEYEYRVSARNEAGTGEASEWVRAGPEEEPVFGDGPPGAPRNLTATPGNKEITLSWEPPADNGNAPATRYRIEWRIDGKDYGTSQWGTSRETTYTTNDQANLANGVKYFFRVKAENGSGNSYGPYGPASEEVSATPTSGSAVDLGTPVLSDTENLHHGMVQLDWQDVGDAGWYVVQYYHIEGGEWLDLPAEGVDIAFHGSSAVVSNLHGLSWLRVGAASCDGASEWSQIEQLFGTNESDWEGVPVPEVEEGDEIEPCPVVLGTPVLSDTETLHHGMVQLDWQDIEDAGWYVVQYYHVKSGEWLDLPAEGVDIAFHGSSAVVSNLHGLSWLRVRAMSCAGESEWSQIEQLFGTNKSDWEGVPVPEVAEGDEIEPCDEDPDTPDNSPATGAPAISGTAQVGETLTANTSGIADADGLSNVQYEYQWLADDSDISGATNATYTLADTDDGKAIKAEVTFTDDAGNAETLTSAATDAVAAASTPNSPATGVPAISGIAQVGETLTANTSEVADADGLSNVQYEYQWLADDAEIAGSIGSTYTLTDGEESKAITVQVSFTDDAGHNETLTSAATDAVVARPNSPATGAPTISGTAQVGETLMADTSGIADADGLSSVRYEYQWLADDSDISGATNATYTLAAEDEGKAIKVQVSFTDDAGHNETLTSAATDAVVARPNSGLSAPPVVDGPNNVNYVENATSPVARYSTDDPEEDAITWGVSGRDGPAFSIDDGVLKFRTPPNYERPADNDADNEYQVDVVATDSSQAGTTIAVTIKVTDVRDPNIVFIMADDVGYEAFGSYGSTQYRTPRLDELASAGVRFTHTYSKPVCTPSRVALMTGKSNIQNYADFGVLLPGQYTFADLFREAGYTTAIAGKWQLHGGKYSRLIGVEADEAGFDTYCLWNTDKTGENRYWNPSIECDGQVIERGQDAYGPDIFTDFLLEFIESNQDGPFFAYYPMVLPHSPFVPPPDAQCPATDDEQCNFEDMVSRLDHNVGRIYDKLAALELLDNTILVFTSDNGTNRSLVSYLDGVEIHGDKNLPTDGGTRVPLIAVVPGGEGGRVIDDLIDFTDFLPTLADAAALTIPEDVALDGVSFWERLQGKNGHPREWIYTYYFPWPYAYTYNSPAQHPEVAYARDKRYKLYSTGDLFDLSEDRHEIHPLPSDHEDSLEARARLQVALYSMPAAGQEIRWSFVNDGATSGKRPLWRPVLKAATVRGNELTLTYAGILRTKVEPPVDAFKVQVDGTGRTVSAVSITASAVTLALASPVTVGQTVTVSYTPGTNALQHVNRSSGNTASALANRAVKNETPPNSPATGAPTITGTAQVGETLTSNTSGVADADGLSNVQYEYQWLADDSDISGATNATYTLTDSEESKAITVRVSFTDDADNEETLTSAATAAVAAKPNSPPTGAPTITGTVQVGETLTADTSGVADADGLSNVQYEYQWLADDSDISGATNATYTLTDSEESKAITVQVSFTDAANNEESLTSAATGAVAGAQPTEPPAKPRNLEATATHDSVTLTWDDPGDNTITGYVILRRIPGVDPQSHFDELVADTGTAATTYTDNEVSAETRYTYRIKAINVAGTSERSRWSHIDTPAAPVPDKPTGLEATESHGQVVLTWNDPGDDSITGYVILRRVRENNTGGDFSVLVADTGSAATTYTDDTVAASTTYTYRIKAINEHGTSERSRWFHIDIPAAP